MGSSNGNPDFWAGVMTLASAVLIAVAVEVVAVARATEASRRSAPPVLLAWALPMSAGVLSLLALGWRWEAPPALAVFIAATVGLVAQVALMIWLREFVPENQK